MSLFTIKQKDATNEMSFDFHLPTSKKALIIFARNPELGKCKTRLAKTIGDENALKIYKALLQHTAGICKDIKADNYVFYSENILKEDLWSEGHFRKKLQHGQDLGARMYNAFSELFAMHYEKIIIIGTDLPDLDATLVNDAFEHLDHFDQVLGPAYDGGYYLLGMKQLLNTIFIHKAWGTSTVLADTLKDLKHSATHLLKVLNDIDTFEDLQVHPQFKQFYSKS